MVRLKVCNDIYVLFSYGKFQFHMVRLKDTTSIYAYNTDVYFNSTWYD